MNRLKRVVKLFKELDTIEKRSFWMISVTVMVLGVLSAAVSAEYTFSGFWNLFSAGLCMLIPAGLMYACSKTGNYHLCYPLLCIGVSGFTMPLIFPLSGGFASSMPMLCLATTLICCFCYSRRWRMISFAFSLFSNLFIFVQCDQGRIRVHPLAPGYENMDIIMGYLFLSLGYYLILNLLINQARIYARSEEIMSAYMDRSVRRRLMEQIENGFNSRSGVPIKNEIADKNGFKCKVTVLFADISRFSSITEDMSPEESAGYLNRFLKVADDCVHRNGGILDKYIGDCAMAYWIDSTGHGEGVFEAVKTVLTMRNELKEQQQEIFGRYGYELEFSAGISYGDVVIGDIGTPRRKDFTIIGDAVNTASRIEDISARGELLVSGAAAAHLRELVRLTPITSVHYLRGKNRSLVIYRVEGLLNPAHEDPSRVAEMDDAADLYRFYVCGCRGSFPVSGIRFSEFGGETSCYILKRNRYAVIIDCGTGLSNSAEILKDCEKVDILLTHVHYDHIMGMLNMSVIPPGTEVRVYGHFEDYAGASTVYNFISAPYWPVNLPETENVDVQIGEEYPLYEGVTAAFYRADHPDGGCVIRLMAGHRKVCVFADMEDPAGLDPEIARNSDLLLYDGMYDDDNYKLHVGWGHSTWQAGVRYGIQEEVQRLVITHHDPVRGDHALKELEKRAQEMSPSVIFARCGDRYIL